MVYRHALVKSLRMNQVRDRLIREKAERFFNLVLIQLLFILFTPYGISKKNFMVFSMEKL